MEYCFSGRTTSFTAPNSKVLISRVTGHVDLAEFSGAKLASSIESTPVVPRRWTLCLIRHDWRTSQSRRRIARRRTWLMKCC